MKTERMTTCIRVPRKVYIELEKYIYENKYYRYEIRPSKVASTILREWLDEPDLDKSKIYKRSSEEMCKLNISLTKDDYDRLFEIYVTQYVRVCNSINKVICNVLIQYFNIEIDPPKK